MSHTHDPRAPRASHRFAFAGTSMCPISGRAFLDFLASARGEGLPAPPRRSSRRGLVDDGDGPVRERVDVEGRNVGDGRIVRRRGELGP